MHHIGEVLAGHVLAEVLFMHHIEKVLVMPHTEVVLAINCKEEAFAMHHRRGSCYGSHIPGGSRYESHIRVTTSSPRRIARATPPRHASLKALERGRIRRLSLLVGGL